MYSVFAPSLCSHSRSALAVNSGPLSERMYSGIPPEEHDLGQELDHLLRADTAGNQNCQTLASYPEAI